MTQHVNVLICTPGHSVIGDYVKSLLETSVYLNNEGLTWAWSNRYSSHVGDAREITLSGSRDNQLFDSRPMQGNITYDKIMWIDSDIVFNGEDVYSLWQHDVDVVTGAYLLGTGEVTAYPEITKPGFSYMEVKEMPPQLVEIEGCGMGFMMVRQGVFESLSRPWFQSPMLEGPRGVMFPIVGEDLAFCERARQAGFRIWLDPTVRVTHNKMMKLTWDGPMP